MCAGFPLQLIIRWGWQPALPAHILFMRNVFPNNWPLSVASSRQTLLNTHSTHTHTHTHPTCLHHTYFPYLLLSSIACNDAASLSPVLLLLCISSSAGRLRSKERRPQRGDDDDDLSKRGRAREREKESNKCFGFFLCLSRFFYVFLEFHSSCCSLRLVPSAAQWCETARRGGKLNLFDTWNKHETKADSKMNLILELIKPTLRSTLLSVQYWEVSTIII